MNVPAGISYGAAIGAAAVRNGLDPSLLAAVAAQETGGPGADSGRNIVGDGGHGHGLFQIDDRYHAFASTAGAMDPAQNANYAASLLASLVKENGGDLHAALSAYNAGSPTATGTVTAWPGGQTLGYADSVMAHYDQIVRDGGGSLPSSAGLQAGAGSPTAAGTAPSTLGAVAGSGASALLGMLTQLFGGAASANAVPASQPVQTPQRSFSQDPNANSGASADKGAVDLVGIDDSEQT